MIRINFALVVLLGFLTACSTSNPPDTVSGRYFTDGKRMDMIPENLLEPSDGVPDLVWLNAARVFRDAWQYDIFLETQYAARPDTGLLDIRPGESLVVVVDGQEFRFHSGIGSLNTRETTKGVVTERVVYPATAANLMAIANAKQVKVRILGYRATVERSFGPRNFERFKKFTDRFVLQKR